MYLCPQVHFSTLPPKPVIPSKQPFKVDLIGGKRYSWCTCGYSKKQVKKPPSTSSCITPVWKNTPCVFPHHIFVFQPFCDGSHKFKAPGQFPLRFVPDKDTTVWLCGCKYTSNPPYCDDTHKLDFIVSAPLYEPTDSWKGRRRGLWTEDWCCCCIRIFVRDGFAHDESGACKPIDRDRCSLSSTDKHWVALISPCLLSISRETQCCINYTVDRYDGVHGGVFTGGDFTKLFIVRLLKYLQSY